MLLCSGFLLRTDGSILCGMHVQCPGEAGAFTRVKVINDSSYPVCLWPWSSSICLCYLTLTACCVVFLIFSHSVSLADMKGYFNIRFLVVQGGQEASREMGGQEEEWNNPGKKEGKQ